jgi:hypothetical protein
MVTTFAVATPHALILTVSHGLLFCQPPSFAAGLMPPFLSENSSNSTRATASSNDGTTHHYPYRHEYRVAHIAPARTGFPNSRIPSRALNTGHAAISSTLVPRITDSHRCARYQ